MVPLELVRTRVSQVWLISSALLFAWMIVQSVNGTYEDTDDAGKALSFTKDAWSWLIPLLTPTLGLIFATFVATWNAPPLTDTVRQSYFRAAFWLSMLYLAAVAVIMLAQPFHIRKGPEDAIALMRMSGFWMGPLQGLLASLVGVMFVKRA